MRDMHCVSIYTKENICALMLHMYEVESNCAQEMSVKLYSVSAPTLPGYI